MIYRTRYDVKQLVVSQLMVDGSQEKKSCKVKLVGYAEYAYMHPRRYVCACRCSMNISCRGGNGCNDVAEWI